MRGLPRHRLPRGARAGVVLGTTVATAMLGPALAADVSAGTMAGLALTSSTSAPGAVLDVIVYRCNAGDDIGFVVDGVSYTETCLLDGVARAGGRGVEPAGQLPGRRHHAERAADRQLHRGRAGSAHVERHRLVPARRVDRLRRLRMHTRHASVADVAGQQLTSECESGVLGRPPSSATSRTRMPRAIFPLTVTLTQPAAVLQGAIYIKDLGRDRGTWPVTTPDPGLAGTGPGDSTITQLVAAAGAVGLGVTCVAWARRRPHDLTPTSDPSPAGQARPERGGAARERSRRRRRATGGGTESLAMSSGRTTGQNDQSAHGTGGVTSLEGSDDARTARRLHHLARRLRRPRRAGRAGGACRGRSTSRGWARQPEADHTVLMGATTYRLMSGLAAEGEPGTDELAGLPKVVFSSTLRRPWRGRTRSSSRRTRWRSCGSGRPPGASSMRTMGSLTLCRALLTAGLVDRFRVVVFPVITGSSGQRPDLRRVPRRGPGPGRQPDLRRAHPAAGVRPDRAGRSARPIERLTPAPWSGSWSDGRPESGPGEGSAQVEPHDHTRESRPASSRCRRPS